MRTEFKLILLLGLVFALLVGCAVQEEIVVDSEVDSLQLPPTWTLPPTSVPRSTATRIPTQYLPNPTPQPIVTSVVKDVFVREGSPVPQPEEVIGVENADQLVELARWGYGAINQVSHTRDGRLMLVQTDVGVYAYQVGTLNKVWRFRPGGRVDTLNLDEDDRVMVQIEGETIFLLNSDNGRVIDSFLGEIQEQAITEPSHNLYHEDGKIIRSSDQSILLKFWELNLPGWLNFAGISPGGNFVVFIGLDSGLAVYRISDDQLVLLFDPENIMSMVIPHLAKPDQLSGPGPDRINTFVFNRSEQFLIAANGRGQIFFFDLQQEELHISLHGNGGKLLIPPYGDQVIYYDGDTIEIYAIPSGEREAEQNFGFCCQEMIYSPGGTRIAQGGMVWNTYNGTFQAMPENEKVIGFSENGSYVYAIREEWWWVERRTADLGLHYQVELDLTPDTELGGMADYSTDYWMVGKSWTSSPDGTLVHGGWYGIPYITWSTGSGEVVSLGLPERDYHKSAFSPNGQYLIEIEDGGTTLIRERQLDGTYAHLERIETWGQDIDFIGNEYLIITDNIVKVYSFPEMELVKEISSDDLIWDSSVSPDGTLLAASLGYEVVLVDIGTGEVLGKVDVSSWEVANLAFSPDGRYLAIAAHNGVIRLWGVAPLSQVE